MDAAALIHDLDYLNPNITYHQADMKMVSNLSKTGHPFQSALAAFVFGIKDSIGYYPARNKAAYSVGIKEAEMKNMINPIMKKI